jgi:hypothetical protein
MCAESVFKQKFLQEENDDNNNNNISALCCNYRIAATLYAVETC